MGKEEQAEELEILESIYPEELEVVDEENLTVHLKLEIEPPKQLRVDIQYTQDYPESSIPLIVISKEALDDDTGAGEVADETERKYDYEFTNADCRKLMDHAKEVGEENLGISSVFTIISAIKEQAEELFNANIQSQEAERVRQLNLEEEKEQAKFKGTPVTKETFAEWRKNFRAEMGWDKPKERPFGRFTGREIFVKGMYKEEDEEAEEEDNMVDNE